MKLFQYEKYTKLQIIIVSIAILVVVNILVSYTSIRFDFSQGKAYTLAPATKKILKNLDDVVTIKLFMSSDLPIALVPLKTDVTDLVGEFKRTSHGKIIVKTLDPKKDTDAQKEAQTIGLPQIQFSQIEQNNYAVSASFFGIEIMYGAKHEVIPQATNTDTLEYDITSAIYKMTQKNDIKVGLRGTNQAQSQQGDQFYTLKTILGKQFQLENVDVASSSGQKIDPSIKTVVVVDADNSAFSEQDIQDFKNYLNNKGQMIFMVDGVYVNDQLQSSEAKHNLFSFFKDYGITLNRNFVLSTQSEIANFTTSSGAFFTNYPYWIKTSNFATHTPEFSNISLLTFPWAASFDIKNNTNANVKTLVMSEKNSWVVDNNAILLPDKIASPDRNTFKKHSVIAEATTKNGGKLTVIASSRFAKEQFLAQGRGNISFMLNLVNDYASGGALSGIRSRLVSVDLIRDAPESSKDPIKYMLIFILPVLIGLYGAHRLVTRK